RIQIRAPRRRQRLLRRHNNIHVMIPGSTRALACPVRRLAERIERPETYSARVFAWRAKGHLQRGRRKQQTRRVRCPVIVLTFVILFAVAAQAAEVIPPKPDRYFNDYASVVSKEAALRFNEQLAQFERETSDQVVVAIFPKMQTESDIADYTQRVAQAWGVGQKERRNGVVLFVFVQDRKMFIQVGYGLEGALPDVTCFDITEYKIKPQFRNNDYEGGLAIGIDSILKAIRGEYKGSGKTASEQRHGSGAAGLLPFLIFVIVLIIISRVMRRLGGYGYSSGRGGPVFLP